MRLLHVTNTATVDGLAFAPDGSRLAAACKKANVRIWDIVSGKRPINLKGTRDMESLGFVGGPGLLAVSNYGTPAMLWDLKALTARAAGPPPGYCSDMAVSPDGSRIVRAEGDVYCRASADGATLWEYQPHRSEREAGRAGDVHTRVRFDGSGSRVFVFRSRVAVLDAATGAELTAFDLSFHKYTSVRTAAVSPDGRWAAVRGIDGTQVRDVLDGKLVFEEPSLAYGYTLEFTPDGSKLVACPYGAERCVDFWEVGSWRKLPSFDPGIGTALSLAFAPDGTLAAAGGFNGQVALWDLD
jgi:WD40 repeat protein